MKRINKIRGNEEIGSTGMRRCGMRLSARSFHQFTLSEQAWHCGAASAADPERV